MDYNNLPGVHAAPNIQSDPAVYELENSAADPDRRLETLMWTIAPWQDRVVLDLGAGTGFHLPFFHQAAAHIIAVEPHGPSRLQAMARCAALGLERTSVMAGSAEHLILPDQQIDVCHVRFAYFSPPHCEPGLRELARVMRPGGTAFIIDNDLRSGTFAHWLRQHPTWQGVDPDTVEQFWADRGFTLARVASEWRFARRPDLEAVVRLEFGPQLAERLLATHSGIAVDYHYAVYYRQF